MNRTQMITALADSEKIWDFIVIGGGASGAGVVLDAASRGYSVLLVEQSDFAKGTSSRSTKLVHGGVRYLQQGNVSLVFEALKERGILLRNAPHLVHDQAFVVPSYEWWEGPFYGIGLKVYDMMAGKEGFGHSKLLSREETLQQLPNLEPEGLTGGVLYYDGQFDDARLVINLLQTAVEQGASVLNYMQVQMLQKENNLISGVKVQDMETGKRYTLQAKTVINATGPFSDSILQMDRPGSFKMIEPSRGTHIVLDKSFLPGEQAIMVPHTDDGRILFAIPWHNRALVGTTDIETDSVPLEPRAEQEEIDFLLEHTARYLKRDPQKSDVKAVFAGIRPLAYAGNDENTAAISREHVVHISASGLVTLAGGKWTTYRKMAEDTVDQAILIAGVEGRPCVTTELNVHGFHRHSDQFEALKDYGSDALEIKKLAEANPDLAKPLCSDPDIIGSEVVWAVRYEMARTVEDFLSRRRRLLLLDAKKSIKIAPEVARLMAGEMKKDELWVQHQVADFRELAQNYILSS